ncbi:type II toxin-antitoxin system RelE/ParE family toxin [Enterococcus sp. 669A]|uniref:Type II toxin-antitoxin system RelE/ParE family toxin n=1 Tax=Candidatus Enterococcus moelleringii TaxID=2815325 RepID=A0ABS3L6U7_9ENTE|nr:type II toxin-antitoxin system RelE/ParE family toxin [Enterococcus sp. 669A]MBO1305342.1 type II toxin-antitoxin system RelE/ParE family toxin [Enterococcus sp. 669A]
MAGENNDQYTIKYTESFKNSLRENIHEWESSLLLSEDIIKKFVHSIYSSINLLKLFPEMHEDVSHIYRFNEPTYRILIGKSFAIFYRLDKKHKIVQIGNLFKQKQMDVTF